VGQQLKPTGKAKTSCPSVSEGNTGLKRFFGTSGPFLLRRKADVANCCEAIFPEGKKASVPKEPKTP
jgi:hypothetical protein